jgi:superfamily II DNA or RNA helicase
MKVTVRILDEVFMAVIGLKSEHIEMFYDMYGLYAPNYFFNPKFKLGRWDGKIRFFQRTAKNSNSGKTYLYLAEEILPKISKLGYKIRLEDNRKTEVPLPEKINENIFSDILHLDTQQPIILKPHQVDAVNSLIEAGHGVVVASTGSGKTLMTSALVKAYDKYNIRSLTIVPNQDLIKQTKNEYINCKLDTGEYSGAYKTIEHKHVVSTWQALKNNPSLVAHFQMVIVDECHGLKGNVLGQILTNHAANIPLRFGFTGTMPKEKTDELAVKVAVGPVRYSVNADHLINQGVLANLQIDILQLEENLEKDYRQFLDECVGDPISYEEFKEQYFPDFSAEKSYLQKQDKRIRWIANMIEERRDNKKGNTLCLVDSISFGRKLAKYINNSVFINGQDVKDTKQRQYVYDLFKDNDNLVVIATVHIAGTGLNIRRIFNLILIDVGKSFIRVIQAVGRGLRKAEDKDFVNIIDVSSDMKYSKRHTTERIKYYKEANYPYKKHKIKYVEQLKEIV